MKLTRSFFLIVAVAAPAFADRTLAKVEVFPDSVALLHARDRQSMIVQATCNVALEDDTLVFTDICPSLPGPHLQH